MKNNNVKDIVKEVQPVDININEILVPILQDTIADSNRHNKRMFILSIILTILLLIISLVSITTVYKQSNNYQEFLNQFEFEGDYTYTQDINADDGSSGIINDGININQ